MPPPNYFFPNRTAAELKEHDRLNTEALQPYGLAGVWADVRSVQADCTLVDLTGAGPGGAGGCLLCCHRPDGQKPPRVGRYQPEHQVWTAVQQGESCYWVGLDKHLPTGPDDVVRKGPNPFDRGYWIELAGRKWFIPVIRDCESGSGLPQDWALEADGTVSTTIQASYRDLWTEFAAVVDLVFDPANREGGETFAVEPGEAMRRCLQALKLRYRIDRGLLNALGLINSHTWFGVLGAMVDLPLFWDVWLAAQDDRTKKNSPDPDRAPAAGSPATAPGGPAAAPTTDPPAPNSS